MIDILRNSLLVPSTDVPGADLKKACEEAYEWLSRALAQHCDRVEARVDSGCFMVAAVWVRGGVGQRVCLAVENAALGKSLNESINNGELTQAEAIRLFTKRRPAWR